MCPFCTQSCFFHYLLLYLHVPPEEAKQTAPEASIMICIFFFCLNLHSKFSMYILLTIHYSFPKMLSRRISSLGIDHHLYSHVPHVPPEEAKQTAPEASIVICIFFFCLNLHSKFSMYILLTIHYSFPKMLSRRISSLGIDHHLYSHDRNV